MENNMNVEKLNNGIKIDYNNFQSTLLFGRKEEYRNNKNFNVEHSILKKYIDKISCDDSHFKIVNNCSNYTTLKYDDMDLIRLKYTDKSKWITIFIPPKYKKEYIDNDLFKEQKNKNQLHWKSLITNDSDLDKFIDICKRDIDFFKQ